MFLQLGTYKFQGIKLPQSWDISYSTEYSQIPLINGKPSVQAVGENLIEQSFGIFLSSEFCNPTEEIAALNLSRINAEVLPLIDGIGRNYGKYVIKNIDVSNTQCLANGTPTAISATISLLEYNSITKTKNTGEALASKLPPSEIKAVQLSSTAQSIHDNITKGIMSSNQISSHVTSEPSIGMYKKIASLASEAKKSFEAANTQINNTKKLIYRVTSLRTALTNAAVAAQFVRNAADINSFNDLLNANVTLGSAVSLLSVSSVPVVAFIGSREGGEYV